MHLYELVRGLAVGTVGALLITSSTMTAAPATAAEEPDVRLLSQLDGLASVRHDVNWSPGNLVTLAAERLDPHAGVTFEYNADPAAGDASAGWTAIEPHTTHAELPYFAVDWAPDPALIGTRIAVRAVATTEATTTYSTRNDVALSGDESPVDAVAFYPSGAFFQQPYADSARTASLLQVDGTTSATNGTVTLSVWDSEVGAFLGRGDLAVERTQLVASWDPMTYVDGGRFTGALDVSGHVDGDVLAVRAERDSDVVLPIRLWEQDIASITATQEVAGHKGTTPVTLQVLDTRGFAVLGAELRRSADGSLIGYTDRHGEVTLAQPNGTTATYYANTTDTDAFEEGVDVATAAVETSAYCRRPRAPRPCSPTAPHSTTASTR